MRWVEISFDCLPMRTIGRLKVPEDASPKFQELCRRVLAAVEKHGAHNSYYLYNARAVYHLTNDPEVGMLEFRWEGTVITDTDDAVTRHCDLTVSLSRETCDWISQPVVDWFQSSVRRAVAIEFDRFIAAGDLEKAKQRVADIEASSDEAGGFVGMYL